MFQETTSITDQPSSSVQFKILESEDEILQAKMLLYRIYCQEIAWKPKYNNPGTYTIRYTSDNDLPYLTNEIQYTEEIWIGVLKNQKVVGCLRLTGVETRSGLFEFELYHHNSNDTDSLRKIYKQTCQREMSQQWELARIGIDKDYRACGYHLNLYKYAALLSKCYDKEIIGVYSESFLHRICLEDITVKIGETYYDDEVTVHLYSFPQELMETAPINLGQRQWGQTLTPDS